MGGGVRTGRRTVLLATLVLGLLVLTGIPQVEGRGVSTPPSEIFQVQPAAGSPWTNLTPSSGNAPPTALGAVLVNDTAAGVDLWFGGSVGNGPSATGATWTFQGGVWSNRTSLLSMAPPARSFGAATYDSANGVVVLFGGLGDPSYLNDTWIWKDGNWTNATPYVGITPPARAEAAIDYDSAEGEILLFGGLGASGPLGDTWVFSGGRWSHLSSPITPGPACCASLGYDSSTGKSLLLLSPSSGSVSYSWEFSGGHWANVSTLPAPPIRQWASLVDDPAVGGLLLFGGSSLPQPPYWPLGDVWIYGGATPHWIQAPTQSPQPEPRWGATIAPMVPADARGCFLLVGGGVTNGTDRLARNVWSGCGNLTTWTQGGSGGGSGGPNTPRLSLTSDRYSGQVPFRTNLTVVVQNGTGPFNLSVCTSLEGCTSSASWSGIGAFNKSILFLTPGSYAISALVTDALGLSASATISVEVSRIGPLVAVPSVGPVSGTTPLVVGFETSVGGGLAPYTVQWDFGDGISKASAPGTNVTHLYANPGTYYPTLEILDGSGQSLNVTLPAIAVHPASPRTQAPGPASVLFDQVLPVAIVVVGLAVAFTVYFLRRRRVEEEVDETLREVSESPEDDVGPKEGESPPWGNG